LQVREEALRVVAAGNLREPGAGDAGRDRRDADAAAEGEADLRYRGQSFELAVPLGPDLPERFHQRHEERYGYADKTRELELVAVRTAEVRPGPALELPAGERRTAEGPAVLELDGATCWLPSGWVGVRDGGAWTLTKA
jgi:N-methylhydantoinase A/oxoprolinase/acetone carboxylase beta subunit